MSFKFIETFLFLSLGITFALIVTLVYHFKKRMENMETKCDTMFDIVQKLATELSSIQKPPNMYEFHSDTNVLDSNSYDNLTENISLRREEILELSGETNIEESNVKDESDNDDSDSDESDNDDTDSDVSDNDDSDSDESVNDNREQISSNNEPSNTIKFDKIDLPEDNEVKVINVSDSDVLEVSSLNDGNLEDLDYIDEDNDSTIEELNEDNLLNVNKIDENENTNNKPSRSALKKLKISDLKDMAKENNIAIDDNATKNTIINLLLEQ